MGINKRWNYTKLMFKLTFRNFKRYRRISKLQDTQSKLLKEMDMQIETYKKDNDSVVDKFLFVAFDSISEHIKTIKKNVKKDEEKMKEICNEYKEY